MYKGFCAPCGEDVAVLGVDRRDGRQLRHSLVGGQVGDHARHRQLLHLGLHVVNACREDVPAHLCEELTQ